MTTDKIGFFALHLRQLLVEPLMPLIVVEMG